MRCANCGAKSKYKDMTKAAPWDQFWASSHHGEWERWARYCTHCKKVFCGQCCFPRWQELKKKEGLDGMALAAKIDADPNARFSETASCPKCHRMPQYEGPGGLCFLATAACGSPDAEEVRILRVFRDRVLRRSAAGRMFVRVYERCSPPLASFIARRDRLRAWVRRGLVRPLARLVRGRR